MKKFTVLLLAVVGIFMLTNSAQALTFELLVPLFEDYPELKPAPDGTPTPPSPWWLKAVFTDVAGGVELTLSANLSEDNFVTEWDFNVADAYLSGLTFAVESVSGIAPTPLPGIGSDAYKADGTGGSFDIGFIFEQSNKPGVDRFDGTDSITYKITSNVTGFNAEAFNVLSYDGTGGWHTAAHIQNISPDPIVYGDDGKPITSTWIGDGKINPIPEPGTILLLGAGLLGLLGFGRKLRK